MSYEDLKTEEEKRAWFDASQCMVSTKLFNEVYNLFLKSHSELVFTKDMVSIHRKNVLSELYSYNHSVDEGGYIYMLTDVNQFNESIVKIGITKNIYSRVSSHFTSNPTAMFGGFCWFENYKDIEKHIKSSYNSVSGKEWFTKEDGDSICSHLNNLIDNNLQGDHLLPDYIPFSLIIREIIDSNISKVGASIEQDYFSFASSVWIQSLLRVATF